MVLTTVEAIYQQIVKQLPPTERLRLVEKIVHDLSAQPIAGEPPERYNWMVIRGIAPNLLCGKDAQEWVSQTRRESEESREKQWRKNP